MAPHKTPPQPPPSNYPSNHLTAAYFNALPQQPPLAAPWGTLPTAAPQVTRNHQTTSTYPSEPRPLTHGPLLHDPTLEITLPTIPSPNITPTATTIPCASATAKTPPPTQDSTNQSPAPLSQAGANVLSSNTSANATPSGNPSHQLLKVAIVLVGPKKQLRVVRWSCPLVRARVAWFGLGRPGSGRAVGLAAVLSGSWLHRPGVANFGQTKLLSAMTGVCSTYPALYRYVTWLFTKHIALTHRIC
jgi:hypothetical protein